MNKLLYNAVIKYANGIDDHPDPTKIDGWKDAMNIIWKVIYVAMYIGIIVCLVYLIRAGIKLGYAKNSDESNEAKRGIFRVIGAVIIIVSARIIMSFVLSLAGFDGLLI